MSEDNLEPLVTQCPNCGTRFRVTEQQLQIAAGRVRCGACLAVFEGTTHLSVDGETLTDVAQAIDVDAMLDELDEITAREPEDAPVMPRIVNEDFIAVSEATLAEQAGDEQPPEDLLALEEQLLNELKSEVAQVSAEVPGLSETLVEPTEAAPAADAAAVSGDATLTEEAAPEATLVTLSEPVDAEPDDSGAATNWADDVAAEVWQDPGNLDPSTSDEATSAHPAAAEALSAEDAASGAADEQVVAASELQDAPLSAQDLDAPEHPEHATDDEEIELTALHVEPEAIPPSSVGSYFEEPEFEYEEPRRKRSWFALLLSLVALVGLPAQVLWFKYDTWVTDPNYRPIYEYICEVGQCQLPVLRDVSKIVSKKSIIRAHPERDDARIVDVLMVNTAEFAQPFPLVELVATSVRGQLVAGRRFKPEEYLKGDAQGAQLMPPQTPIHISLEIQDPSEDALSFEVKFR